VPALDAQLGYEWFATSLFDSGASSTRCYRGFVGALAANAMFSMTSRFALGLRMELRGGVFHRTARAAPGIDAAGPTEGNTLHLWPTLGARAMVTF